MSRLSKALGRVSGAVRQLAPAATLIPGPIGAAATGFMAARSLLGRASSPPGFSTSLDVVPDSGPMMSGLPMAIPAVFGGAVMRGAGGLMSRLGAGGLVGAAAGVLRTAAGKIRGVVLASGRFLSTRKAAALARRVGIEAAAVGLGIGAVELAEMVLADSESRARRRGRGISGADLRRTRRTIKKVMSAHRYIVQSCHGAGMSARRPRITVSGSPGVITRAEAARALRR